jgi:hypothetical protein
MTRAQFIFSLGSGAALLTAGAALASAGIADWGLFWVGSIIGALSLATRLKESGVAATLPAPRPLPIAERVKS